MIFLIAYPMTKSGDYDFTYTFSARNNGELVEFSIVYSDSQNNSYVLPQTGKYKFTYGSDIISLNLEIENPTSNYEVSDFYPNPFNPAAHRTTRINYYSSGKELFKLIIIDGSGQKVKEVSTNTFAGENYFEWDGFADRGYLCASGVYYALIQIGDKEYGKKLVLLK